MAIVETRSQETMGGKMTMKAEMTAVECTAQHVEKMITCGMTVHWGRMVVQTLTRVQALTQVCHSL
jgi:hypothetical protein